MSDACYHCQLPGRVAAVRRQTALNGIEFLEVVSPDQTKLAVHFIHGLPQSGATVEVPPAPAPALSELNFVIDGGERFRGLKVIGISIADNVATLTTNGSGDFSLYTLRLVSGPDTRSVPPGYDPRLSSLEFSFKASCPSEFDCRTVTTPAEAERNEPDLGYLAKDYPTFRRLMLDRMSALMPNWKDRSPADPLITLVESLAATADQLSYWQDSVAMEAYLGTARKRTSLRRHARLLDYRLHEGCCARTWIQIEYRGSGAILPENTLCLTRGTQPATVLSSAALNGALRENPVVFRTLHSQTLDPHHNSILLYTWSDSECSLPKGATRATLDAKDGLSLQVGDWLLLEEIRGPETGTPGDANPQHRQVVRLTQAVAGQDPLTLAPVLEVEWSTDDALTFPLCLGQAPGASSPSPISVARGNLVFAEHGLPIGPEKISTQLSRAGGVTTVALGSGPLAFSLPFDAAAFADEATQLQLPLHLRRTDRFFTARQARVTDSDQALPAVALVSDGESWSPRLDLLSSGPDQRDFVVEVEQDRTARLRFGDGLNGRRPAAGSLFLASYRLGGGSAGNVGADTLVRIASSLTGLAAVRNPLGAAGGIDPETADSVRQFAPHAFRRQERAVTEDDWVEVAQRFPGVQRAAAQFRWTGSWHTVYVTVDRLGGLPVRTDARFLRSFLDHLNRYRIAGYDLEVNEPTPVSLDLKLEGCVRPGHLRSDVKAALLDVFSSSLRKNGQTGFFHPDRWTFGQPVHLSQLYAAAAEVPGLRDFEITRFQRHGKLPAGELEAGVITLGNVEVARCEGSRNFPEHGLLEIELEGGA